jgi:hypothetical protein
VIAGVDFLIYWNVRLYYRAGNIDDSEKKTEVLNKANQFYPFNDLVFYELGKAYHVLGSQNLADRTQSESYLRESVENYKHSIRLNPASYLTHYRFAEALNLMSYIMPSSDLSAYEEYKKVALLLGHNHMFYYEVAKILLSRWNELSEEEKDFAIEVLGKIGEEKDSEKLQSLMQIWDMNEKDYSVMERILPENAQIYRMYAKFLGERSLSLEERHKFLAKAEHLDFETAKNRFISGENELLYYRVKDAFEQFNSCLNILKRVKFYQNLIPQNLIDISEFNNLQKLAFLNLAKCRLEEGAEFKEVEDYLQKYLFFEDRVLAVNELESYLTRRNLINDKLDPDFNDLEHLYFQMFLYFKQSRYRDVARVGRLLQRSLVVVPEDMKRPYIKILHLIGDSLQKLDFVYDASEFYMKAQEIEIDNLDTLLKMLQNYERLGETDKIENVKEETEKILSQQKIESKDRTINKGQSLSRKIILDGREIQIELYFRNIQAEIKPLIAVFFNGQVVFEAYLQKESISLPLVSKVGENTIHVVAVNRSAELTGIEWKASDSKY